MESVLLAQQAPGARAAALLEWVSARIGCHFDWVAINSDAGARRYYRVHPGPDSRQTTQADGHTARSWVAVDAPPDGQTNEAFVDIAERAAEAGLNVPKIHALDRAEGFFLLTDLGDQRYLEAFATDDADRLMRAAVDVLIDWQSTMSTENLPVLDRSALQQELCLFRDWYVQEHLDCQLGAADTHAMQSAFDTILDRIERQHHVLVHRDYIPRNLMVTEPLPGIIDFQDARAGPIAYDVASLCRDAFISWPTERIEAWQYHYWTKARGVGLPVASHWPAFAEDLAWVGIQRHLKVLGIFARLRWRDGKHGYIDDASRFIEYVRPMVAAHPELAALAPFLRLA